MAIGRGGKATASAIVVASLALFAGACDSSHKAAAPTLPPSISTTTIVGAAPSDVIGWITPTLNNGIAFVNGVPAGAPMAQLLRAAQSLSIACTVSEGDLKQAVWTGPASAARTALSSTLAQTVTLVAKPPASGFSTVLGAKIHTISENLKVLTDEVRP